MSIDSKGYSRIEKILFEAYSESTCLVEAVRRYRERTGYYQERILADQIYRTRGNRNFCKKHGIRLSGPKHGRPSTKAKADKRQEYQDNTDRIEIERTFSLDKRCYGMGLITTKLEETHLTSITLFEFISNFFGCRVGCFMLYYICFENGTDMGSWHYKYLLNQQTLNSSVWRIICKQGKF